MQRRTRVGRRIIVAGNESPGGRALMAELESRARREPGVRFHIVVPLAAGGDLTAARERLEAQLGLLESIGVDASGEIGSSDPLAAIEAALRREPAAEGDSLDIAAEQVPLAQVGPAARPRSAYRPAVHDRP